MGIAYLLVVLVFCLFIHCKGSEMCLKAYWSSSFSETGRLACPDKTYIAGFISSKSRDTDASSFPYLVRGAECCNETSPEHAKQNTKCVDISADIGKYYEYTCPHGYFMTGIKHNGNRVDHRRFLTDNEQGYCCKPEKNSLEYKECQVTSDPIHIYQIADSISCVTPGYYLVAIKWDIDSKTIQEYSCCSMTSSKIYNS